jgi:hypothetical protein
MKMTEMLYSLQRLFLKDLLCNVNVHLGHLNILSSSCKAFRDPSVIHRCTSVTYGVAVTATSPCYTSCTAVTSGVVWPHEELR